VVHRFVLLQINTHIASTTTGIEFLSSFQPSNEKRDNSWNYGVRKPAIGIDECDCEKLSNEFAALKTDYQMHHGRAYDD
jgi:hypothetical protein